MELQNEVKSVLKPWRNRKEEPPFTAGELITMALVMRRHNEEMTFADILDWLGSTFAHYKNVVTAQGFAGADISLLVRKAAVGSDVDRALHQFNLPAIVAKTPLPIRQAICKVSVPAAHIYLQHALNTQRQGTFPFLRLPAEIRGAIYGMVLLYPRSGLLIGPKGGSTRQKVGMISKDFSAQFSFTEWNAPESWRYCATYEAWIEDLLALLLVNKQIFKEAFSCFYRENTFVFNSVDDMGHYLRLLPRYRRQHITQIAFNYRGMGGSKVANAAMGYLGSLPNLQKLYIDFAESLLERLWPTPRAEREFIAKFPGISKLKTIRGLDKIGFGEDCPILKSILEDEMRKPATKNRKERAVEISEWSRPKRIAASKKTRGS